MPYTPEQVAALRKLRETAHDVLRIAKIIDDKVMDVAKTGADANADKLYEIVHGVHDAVDALQDIQRSLRSIAGEIIDAG